MRIPVILAAAALGLFTLAAKADTFQIFDLNATFLEGETTGTISGTVDLDLTSGHELDSTADLTYINDATTVKFTGYSFGFGDTNSPATVFLVFYANSYTDQFILEVPVTNKDSLAGFSGGLCTQSPDTCSSYDASITLGASGYNAYKGTFAPTPEPASVALLATSLLGFTGPIRRRLRRTA